MNHNLRGVFYSAPSAQVNDHKKEGGRFFIRLEGGGEIVIELTVPADRSWLNGTFASIRIHYDGLGVLRALQDIGFLALFESIKASTFYDVVQCCALSGVPIMYYGGEDTKEVLPRKIYEALYS